MSQNGFSFLIVTALVPLSKLIEEQEHNNTQKIIMKILNKDTTLSITAYTNVYETISSF